MNEEEKKAIEFIQEIIDFLGDDDFPLYTTDKNKFLTILDLLGKQQKELNNLKEIEKTHKEENGKLRVELEQKEQIIKRLEQDVEGYRDLSKQIQADYSKQIREYEEGYNE